MKYCSLLIASTLCVLFLFSACASLPSDSSMSAQEEVGNSTVTSNQTCGAVKLLSKWNGLCEGTSSEAGYYFPVIREDGSFNIVYLDYATKQEIILCASPNCTHSNESCSGWYPPKQGGLIPLSTGKKLLMISRGLDLTPLQENIAGIDSMDLNGINRLSLVKFDTAAELLPPFVGNDNFLFCVYQNTLQSSMEKKSSLAQINLTTGEVLHLQDFAQRNISILGAFDENIFLLEKNAQDTKVQYRLLLYKIPENQYVEIDSWCNFEKLPFILDGGYGFLEEDGSFTYCNLRDDSPKMQKIENTQLPIDKEWKLETVDIVDTFDDKVIFRIVHMGKEPSERTEAHYGFSVEEATVKALSLQSDFDSGKKPIDIVACLQDKLLVIAKVAFQEKPMLSEDGTPFKAQMLCNQYALISKEDYWNSNPTYANFDGIWF